MLSVVLFTLVMFSSQTVESVINENISATEKILKLEEIKKEAQKEIDNLKKAQQQEISQAKKEAVAIMRDKKSSPKDIYLAWEKFTNIAKGSKYEKDGVGMMKKYYPKAKAELDKDKAKTEESLTKEKKDNESDKNSKNENETVELDKNSQKENKTDDSIDKNSDKSTENTLKKNETADVNNVDSHKKTVIKEHQLLNKSVEIFRAPVFNREVVKVGMFDISQYTGAEAANRKKLTLLTFYANFCKPCKKELPFLNKLYTEYKDKGLLVVAVNTDKDKDELAEVQEFIKDNELSYPVLKDSFNLIAQRYKIESFPTMFLINSDGKIVDVTVGYDDDEAGLKSKIEGYLK
ncbi:TlpA family protein disulfide reductase [bacterium]|nr:TlpA family protein disulfide reductase [bacterium]